MAHRREGATLEALRSETLDDAVVHLSMHGWYPRPDQGDFYNDSYLLMSSSSGLPSKRDAAFGRPDGKLTPKFLIDNHVRLTNSHVSMAACVSGLAREGVGGDALGLDWALIQTGASSILSSHWNVGAANTARLFAAFYDNWLVQGQSRASALRAAVLSELGDDRSPQALYRYAGFSLTGDFR